MTEEIVLPKFEEEDVLRLLSICRNLNNKVAIEIFKNGRTSLRFLPDHLNADKVDWLRRKRNSVLYFGLSTDALYKKMNGEELLLEEKYGLKQEEYTITPGSVPIRVRGAGLIGALSITGLSPEEDHALAVSLLQELLEE